MRQYLNYEFLKVPLIAYMEFSIFAMMCHWPSFELYNLLLASPRATPWACPIDVSTNENLIISYLHLYIALGAESFIASLLNIYLSG